MHRNGHARTRTHTQTELLAVSLRRHDNHTCIHTLTFRLFPSTLFCPFSHHTHTFNTNTTIYLLGHCHTCTLFLLAQTASQLYNNIYFFELINIIHISCTYLMTHSRSHRIHITGRSEAAEGDGIRSGQAALAEGQRHRAV